MNDKQFRDVAIVVALAAIAWFLWRRHRTANASAIQPQPMVSAPGIAPSPIDYMYAANPAAFGPTQIGVNVTPQLPAGLSDQYIPLFGFVGIAQGETLAP